jgi:hypothetical protein
MNRTSTPPSDPGRQYPGYHYPGYRLVLVISIALVAGPVMLSIDTYTSGRELDVPVPVTAVWLVLLAISWASAAWLVRRVTVRTGHSPTVR